MTRKRKGRPLTIDDERDRDQATIALVNSILDKKPVNATALAEPCTRVNHIQVTAFQHHSMC